MHNGLQLEIDNLIGYICLLTMVTMITLQKMIFKESGGNVFNSYQSCSSNFGTPKMITSKLNATSVPHATPKTIYKPTFKCNKLQTMGFSFSAEVNQFDFNTRV